MKRLEGDIKYLIQDYANRLRKQRPKVGDKWHLDKAVFLYFADGE